MGNTLDDFQGSGHVDKQLSRIKTVLIEARGCLLEAHRSTPYDYYIDMYDNLDCMLHDALDATDDVRRDIIGARIRKKQSN